MNKISYNLKSHPNNDFLVIELVYQTEKEKHFHTFSIFYSHIFETKMNEVDMVNKIVDHFSSQLISQFGDATIEFSAKEITDDMREKYEERKKVEIKKSDDTI